MGLIGAVGALTLALGGLPSCGSGSSNTNAAPPGNEDDTKPAALSIQGTLKDASPAPAGNALVARVAAYTAAITYSDLLVSCVTFTNPPVAGSGGTVDAAGVFTVTFPDGTVGSNFGCFISAPADETFIPIPMVFVDPTQKNLSGQEAKTTRLAVTASIVIPDIALDLDSGTAEADVTSIQKADTGSTDDVLKTANGEKFDFTGNWIIGDVAAKGITLPEGYVRPCTQAEAFDDFWTAALTEEWGAQRCNGPQVGMKIFMQRISGKSFTPDAACRAAVDASNQQGTPITTCAGTVGTEDRYAVQMWAQGGGGGDICRISHPAQTGDDTRETCKAKWLATMGAVPEPESMFNACGRRLGFSNVDARARAGVDLTSDPSYVASGSFSGSGDEHYYDGPFTFPTSITLTNSELFGACDTPPCKPFAGAANLVSDGWKLDQAQVMWPQQNNCKPVAVTVGGKPAQASRCFGTFYPSCTEQPPSACSNTTGAKPAFQEGTSLGCSDSLGTPIDFSNWNDFWCQPSDSLSGSSCHLDCTSAGEVSWVTPTGLVAAGYSVSACHPKSINDAAPTFVPRDSSGQPITGFTGTITCRNAGQLFDASSPLLPVAIQTMDSWQKFRSSQASAGQRCAAMLDGISATGADLDRLELAQLQCYAQAYERASNAFGGCSREVSFNWGAENWWDFVADNYGPAKARGEVAMELFNYTDTDAGSLSFISSRMDGVQMKDSSGYTRWLPCRVNESNSITLKATSSTEMLLELTMVKSMVDRGNAGCVAAVEAGRITTGTQKMMFTMTRE